MRGNFRSPNDVVAKNPTNTKAARAERQQARATAGLPAKGRIPAAKEAPPPAAKKTIKRAPAKPAAKKNSPVFQTDGWELAPVPRGVTLEQAGLGLRATSTPGVFINSSGVLVDEDGCMVEFGAIKKKDEDRFDRALGRKVETPAQLLEATAMDPTMPLNVRLEAAKAAAPYTDRKKGTDVEAEGLNYKQKISRNLRGLSDGELEMFEALLCKVEPELLEDKRNDSA